MILNKYLFNIKRKALFFVEEHYAALPLIVALTYKCDIGCFYCNTKGLSEIFHKEMHMDDFINLLGWMKKQRIHKIMFAGGEPTQHTRFEQTLELCKKNKIACYMASNCAYHDNINHAVAKNIKVLFVNCSTVYASHNRLDLLNKLKFLSERGVKLILRVNVSTTDKAEIDWIRQIARELNARIRIAIVNSSAGSRGQLDTEKIRTLVLFTEEFAKQCLKENIYVYLARPLPRCLFDSKKWQELRQLILVKSKCFVGYRGNFATRAVVNPDLSVFGCFKNFKKAENILQFSSFEKLSEFYKIDANAKLKHCVLDNENNCRYLLNKECSGACFDYV